MKILIEMKLKNFHKKLNKKNYRGNCKIIEKDTIFETQSI